MPPLHIQQHWSEDDSDDSESFVVISPIVDKDISVATTSNTTFTDEVDEAALIVNQLKQQLEQQQPRRSSTVRFGSVQVREYDRIVGDHPDTKYGPPIGIGWDYEIQSELSLDDYENTRKATRQGVRRLTSMTRRNILRNVDGVTEDDIQHAENEVQRIKQQREETKTKSSSSNKLVKFGRKITKRLSSPAKLLQNFSAATTGGPLGMMSMGMMSPY